MTYLKIKEDGTMEVQLETTKDRKLQYNDVIIQYLCTSNFISISLDAESVIILANYSVCEKGKPVSFKMKSEESGKAIRFFDVKNISLF